MIPEKIGTVGLEIVVREDHACGWQPIVAAAPGDLIGYQRPAEEIANRLRFQFDLRNRLVAVPPAAHPPSPISVLAELPRLGPVRKCERLQNS